MQISINKELKDIFTNFTPKLITHSHIKNIMINVYKLLNYCLFMLPYKYVNSVVIISPMRFQREYEFGIVELIHMSFYLIRPFKHE